MCELFCFVVSLSPQARSRLSVVSKSCWFDNNSNTTGTQTVFTPLQRRLQEERTFNRARSTADHCSLNYSWCCV